MHRLGTKVPAQEQKALETEVKLDIPYYDFREEKYLTEKRTKRMIRDQGNCGASWAFSTIGFK
jgi:hypothetical protein